MTDRSAGCLAAVACLGIIAAASLGYLYAVVYVVASAWRAAS